MQYRGGHIALAQPLPESPRSRVIFFWLAHLLYGRTNNCIGIGKQDTLDETRWIHGIGELGAVLAALQVTIAAAIQTRLLVLRPTSGILAWEGVSTGSRARCRISDVRVPPIIKLRASKLPFHRLISFEKIDDELVELFVIEPVVVARPVGGVGQSKMKLNKYSL